MSRTLTLKLFIHQENGLSLTVKRSTVTLDSEGAKETIATEKTDAWAPSSVCSAVEELVTEYLSEIAGDPQEETPIEAASR